MAKRKAPRTLAEEVADLDDPTPKDLDPEQQGSEHSSDGSTDEDIAQATEHYIDTGKSKLRKADPPSLGPEYSGSHIRRDNLFNDVDMSDDDPFATDQSQQSGASDASDIDEYADPDIVDLNLEKNIGLDGEIDSDEAFGEDDGDKFQGYTFRGSKSGRKEPREQGVANGHADAQGMDTDSGGFSDMDSETIETTQEANRTNRTINGAIDTTLDPGHGVDADNDIDIEDTSTLSSEDEGSGPAASSSDSDNSSTSPPADSDRAALRKIVADSQKVMTSSLSAAAKADVAKGRAIKQQRTAFDSLLSTRIRLQKALVATNSLPTTDHTSSEPTNPAVEAAEKATVRLWSTLDSLRQTLEPNSSPDEAIESPSDQTDFATPISTLWTRMQTHERLMRPRRLSILNKWSSKTAPISTLPRANKFSTTPTQQPLSAVLEQQLTSVTNMEKLIAKTQIPRSCAPMQAAAAALSAKSTSNHDTSPSSSDTLPIYDDADFYSILLRDLLEQRSSDLHATTTPIPGVATTTIPGIKDPAFRIHKKRVDTKASKGRKIRYTVQEKVQNFMAPDDRGDWGETQRGELFRGLLGMKGAGGDDEFMNGDEIEEDGKTEEGLRLFRR
ncbi:MAG: hypothetical protein Q9171_005991 [Xanthocarpia ochracea]